MKAINYIVEFTNNRENVFSTGLIFIVLLLLFWVGFVWLFMPPHFGPEKSNFGKAMDWLVKFFKPKPPHVHALSSPQTIEHAPTKSGQHTTYAVYACLGCKKAEVFPSQNFGLTTDEHQIEVKSELLKQGLVLSVNQGLVHRLA